MIKFLGFAAAAAFMGLVAAQESAPEASDAASTAPTEETISVMPDWPVPEPVDFVCPFKGEFDYEPGEISCGFIAVPENREDPDSRTIRLHFVKIAATGEESEYRADPVIYLTGGPGVGVNMYAERLREHAILEQRDLYILEQRGIGASGNLLTRTLISRHSELQTRSLARRAGEVVVESTSSLRNAASGRVRSSLRACLSAPVDCVLSA